MVSSRSAVRVRKIRRSRRQGRSRSAAAVVRRRRSPLKLRGGAASRSRSGSKKKSGSRSGSHVKSGSHSPNYKRMAMYGAAGVAGLGALYGAKKFWDQKPPPRPTPEEIARLQRAEVVLKNILELSNSSTQQEVGHDKIKEQSALLTEAINRLASKDLTVAEMTQARANVDRVAENARAVLQQVQEQASTSSEGYSKLQTIVAGLGALVAVGAATYLGYYGINSTFETIQSAASAVGRAVIDFLPRFRSTPPQGVITPNPGVITPNPGVITPNPAVITPNPAVITPAQLLLGSPPTSSDVLQSKRDSISQIREEIDSLKKEMDKFKKENPDESRVDNEEFDQNLSALETKKRTLIEELNELQRILKGGYRSRRLSRRVVSRSSQRRRRVAGARRG